MSAEESSLGTFGADQVGEPPQLESNGFVRLRNRLPLEDKWTKILIWRQNLMPRSIDEQKRIESWFLAAARNAGAPIPSGESPAEEPDFRFQTTNGALGIELSEVLRPASSNNGILPVAEESFHREIIETARRDYYGEPDANPVHVSVYFTKTRGMKRSKHEMARTLSEFVHANAPRANPTSIFRYGEAPEGFDSVLIEVDHSGDWWSGESGGVTLAEIRPQVEARIAAKDKLVETYRSNLPDCAELWLLLYTGVTVARSMLIPRDVEAWRIPFRFDRVFWFAALEGRFAEIQKTSDTADWDASRRSPHCLSSNP